MINFPHHFRSQFAGKRCVVTGGTGLIGRAVSQALYHLGADVVMISLDDIDLGFGTHAKLDITNYAICCQTFNGADYVFHLAGVKGSPVMTKTKPASFFVPILQMNTNVLEACREVEVPKVVYTSSIGAYGPGEILTEEESLNMEVPPMDSFPGYAKRMGELQIQAYKIQGNSRTQFSVLRPCNIFGPGDNFDPANAMVIPSLMAKIRKFHHTGEPVVVWGDGSPIRDVLYSEDAAYGILCAALYGTYQWPYLNLGAGEGVSIRQIVETLHKIVSFEYQFDTSKPNGFPKRILDMTHARELWPWSSTTPLQEGLIQTWQWYLQHEQEYLQRKNYFVT